MAWRAVLGSVDKRSRLLKSLRSPLFALLLLMIVLLLKPEGLFGARNVRPV